MTLTAISAPFQRPAHSGDLPWTYAQTVQYGCLYILQRDFLAATKQETYKWHPYIAQLTSAWRDLPIVCMTCI